MPRAQFVEIVTVALGPGGSLIPVPGITAAPMGVNTAGTEITQSPAYANRTGSALAPSLTTDQNGVVAYWLEMGDYNIHFSDQHTPPRITPYVRGFASIPSDISTIVQEADRLAAATGDLKFSLQVGDHGLLPDGSFAWILMMPDAGGNGRLISSVTYAGLWSLLGSPAVDGNGNFRLPNLSGRSFIAAGQGNGLSLRNPGAMLGEESHTLVGNEMPSHAHGGATGNNNINHSHGINFNTGNAANAHTHNITVEGHTDYDHAFGADFAAIVDVAQANHIGDWQHSAHGTSGVYLPTAPHTGWHGGKGNHRHAVTAHGASGDDLVSHHHTVSGNTAAVNVAHTHTISSAGNDQAHNNMQPSRVQNLFVRS